LREVRNEKQNKQNSKRREGGARHGSLRLT
jgi:hypothetical protein